MEASEIDARDDPLEPSARDGVSPAQTIVLLGAAIGAGLVVLLTQAPTTLLMLAASAVFLVVIALNLGAAIESLGADQQLHHHDRAAVAARGRWPTYTILVPLYRETAVAEQLLGALAALDYPRESLEILFLVEVDDRETAGALRSRLPSHARVVVTPDGQPRTKPRALNHGLSIAKGQYVTVFDAEDIPEPDQLMRAVMLFERAPRETLCLQARLCIDNIADGWLPLMLSIEYMALFDSLKCGLARAALPVPLGGTSNHFRRRDLLALGGWDSWNVAEDADLGLRIARRGGLVLDLPSTTYEEAPIHFEGWLRQRRRWFKGWIQTAVTNARRPRGVIGQMGLTAWAVAQISILGLVLSALSFPFFSTWILWNILSGALFDAETTLALVANSVAIVVAGTGGLTMAVPAIIGLRRRRLWHLAPWLVTLPGYLMLVSLAAWMALWDLQRRPFHWGKTEHGLGRRNLDLFRNRR